ncbi:hypothetical protein V6N11_035317 [Hibiscus sabdariffa]|uniref:RNase H type-1 domain-containing protein n=1 Tax=Hibiscus sabdariffa TaxID=183260 RepID=A0ABR2R058_9ROSI
MGGVGGVLRNHLSVTLAEFSRSIGVLDPASAEILTIKEAISIFISSRWSKDYHLIVESDSNNVVNWIKRSHYAPTSFKYLVQSCLEECKELSWEINCVDRNINFVADRLAKAGINRQVPHLLLEFDDGDNGDRPLERGQ